MILKDPLEKLEENYQKKREKIFIKIKIMI